MKKTSRRGKKKPFTVQKRLAFDSLELTWFIDPQNGSDETGEGSEAKPVRTIEGLHKLWTRIENEIAEGKRLEEEQRKQRDEDAKQRDAERAKAEAERAERKAKEKELDDRIALLETELTSLEKTYLETQHLFEIAQLELIAGETVIQGPKAIATQLHRLRMLLMARTAEHDALVEERKSKQFHPWALFGGFAVMAGAALWAWALYSKNGVKTGETK